MDIKTLNTPEAGDQVRHVVIDTTLHLFFVFPVLTSDF